MVCGRKGRVEPVLVITRRIPAAIAISLTLPAAAERHQRGCGFDHAFELALFFFGVAGEWLMVTLLLIPLLAIAAIALTLALRNS